ncbi:MAG: sel1 repeat family protein [Firmicutes bacterium]|nr:sel1 repeat family protein [Bacillota bacterium]
MDQQLAENARAAYEEGLRYKNGDGVRENPVKAAKCFQEAAEGGHVRAQMTLAKCFDEGDGVPQDAAQATYWYEQAAGQGNEKAQMETASRYQSGRGVAADAQKAI